MEMILFIGIQATGKSSFYKERFYSSHVRVNLDMLKTRHREDLLIRACLEGQQRFVVDNTNLSKQERFRYILQAREKRFRVIGYFFSSRVAESLLRNANRTGEQRVPDKAIFGASGRLELPNFEEGFDQLHFVRINSENQFVVEEWKNEI